MDNKLESIHSISLVYNSYKLKLCITLLYHSPEILETEITQYIPELREITSPHTPGESVNR